MITAKDIKGLLPALVTPFSYDGSLNLPALESLVARMFESGAKGVVPLGGTGEYTALSQAERVEVVRTAVAAAKGRGPVIAGVLSPGFSEALSAATDFKNVGADAVMVLTPYYVIARQNGLLAYFTEFFSKLGLPVLLYENPSRTYVSLSPETICNLSKQGSVIGIKFSNYDVVRFTEISEQVDHGNFALLSGEELLVACHLKFGASGAVLAVSNLYPKIWSGILNLEGQDRVESAVQLQQEIRPLIGAVFSEPNPGPLKYAMRIAGYEVGSVRLPLLEPAKQTMELCKKVIEQLPSIFE